MAAGSVAWRAFQGKPHLRCLRWIVAYRTAECKTRSLHFQPRPKSPSWRSSLAGLEASYSQLGIYCFSNAGAKNPPREWDKSGPARHVNVLTDIPPTMSCWDTEKHKVPNAGNKKERDSEPRQRRGLGRRKNCLPFFPTNMALGKRDTAEANYPIILRLLERMAAPLG